MRWGKGAGQVWHAAVMSRAPSYRVERGCASGYLSLGAPAMAARIRMRARAAGKGWSSPRGCAANIGEAGVGLSGVGSHAGHGDAVARLSQGRGRR